MKALLTLAMACLSLSPATANSQTNDLTAAIAQSFPGAAIVRSGDVDSASCAPLSDSPGLVSADFDGDGRGDHAALLRLRFTGKEDVWQGKPVKEAEFALVIFVTRGAKNFNAHVANRYTGDLPTSVALDLQKPGTIRDRETQRNVRLRHQSVLMSFCERSSVVYYVSDGRIREVWLTD